MSETKFIRNKFVRIMTSNAIVAALYVVLTLACYPLSFGELQIRFSEFLMLLVFFNPYYTIGLTLGCFLSNIFSSVGPIDMLLGTLATLLACVIMNLLSRMFKCLILNAFVPCFVNGLIVPIIIYVSSIGAMEFNFAVYMTMFGWVFLGEFIAIIVVGYPLFMVLSKKVKPFHTFILSTRNQDYKF